jgi:glycosyltransferase involved in cell wall biosynthesis
MSVASDVGGLKFSVVSEQTGLLVTAQDVSKFAHAIGRIVTDDVWAKKLRKQAAARVQQNFSWTGVTDQLSDLYRTLLTQASIYSGVAKGSSPTSTLLPKRDVKAS